MSEESVRLEWEETVEDRLAEWGRLAERAGTRLLPVAKQLAERPPLESRNVLFDRTGIAFGGATASGTPWSMVERISQHEDGAVEVELVGGGLMRIPARAVEENPEVLATLDELSSDAENGPPPVPEGVDRRFHGTFRLSKANMEAWWRERIPRLRNASILASLRGGAWIWLAVCTFGIGMFLADGNAGIAAAAVAGGLSAGLFTTVALVEVRLRRLRDRGVADAFVGTQLRVAVGPGGMFLEGDSTGWGLTPWPQVLSVQVYHSLLLVMVSPSQGFPVSRPAFPPEMTDAIVGWAQAAGAEVIRHDGGALTPADADNPFAAGRG